VTLSQHSVVHLDRPHPDRQGLRRSERNLPVNPSTPLPAFFWWLVRRGRTGAGRAGGVLHVWVCWERLERRRHHVRELCAGSIFDISIERFAGTPLPLANGQHLERGDRIVELHLDNRAVSIAALDVDWNPWRVVQNARVEMARLARLIDSGELGPVIAVHAVSLYALALRRLGFRVRALPDSIHTRLSRFFFVGLFAVYNPRGWAGATHARRRGWPAEAWIGTDAFLQRYPDAPTAGAASKARA
jgi:hypothetical protein